MYSFDVTSDFQSDLLFQNKKKQTKKTQSFRSVLFIICDDIYIHNIGETILIYTYIALQHNVHVTLKNLWSIC